MLNYDVNNGAVSVQETGRTNIRTRTTYERSYVQALFDSIAVRYDLLNHLLSSGIDIYWRAKAVRLLLPYLPERILDIATGTADLAIQAATLHPKQILGIDISEEMLRIGRKKIRQRNLAALITLQTGDAENLLFPGNSFDAVMVAFGVRNFSHLERGLNEMRRVLRDGGVALILEFSRPTNVLVRLLYSFYSRSVIPAIGRLISKSKEAYRYLPSTVSEFPDGEEMTSLLRDAGFSTATSYPLTFRIATVYLATK